MAKKTMNKKSTRRTKAKKPELNFIKTTDKDISKGCASLFGHDDCMSEGAQALLNEIECEQDRFDNSDMYEDEEW